jgi:two-component system NtrC family sensor kinase
VVAWVVTKELTKLVYSSRKIADGDLNQQVRIKTSDELRILGDSFNKMASRLRDSHANLEDQVKERTAELLESKRKLEALFNGITDLISVMDPDYNIIMANHSVEKLMNQSRERHSDERLNAGKCYARYFQKDSVCDNCPVQKTKETKKPAFAEVEHFGETLHLYTYPIITDQGKLEAIIEFGKVVTREKALQKQLIQSAKLASMGEMASGIAHEIRNPLAGIKSGAQFIEKRLREGDAATAEVVAMIIGEIKRLDEVVTSFLDFARPAGSSPVKMRITDVIDQAVAVTEEQMLQQRVRLLRDYDPRIAELMIDGKQMEQVFLNMIINSLQVMPEGGTLHIKTSLLGDRVRITVTDSGPGILEENIDKIFEPFFTTRSQGTGLGLSITRRILEEHGGSITVESKAKDGTVFTVELPLNCRIST